MMMPEYRPEALDADGLLPVLSSRDMRAADRAAIEEAAIPGAMLMETAGRAVYSAVQDRFPGPQGVIVFCGPGNNGGDGFVAARLLAQSGRRVTVVTVGTPHTPSDASLHLSLLERLSSPDNVTRLEIIDAESFLASPSPRPIACCVDALLGTGVDREVTGQVGDLVDWMNACGRPVIAVDIPTGLHADTGEILGRCVMASDTVTMAALKAGLLFGQGPTFAGRVHVAEIGIPRDVLSSGGRPGLRAITTEAVTNWLPARAHDAHKYSAGFVLVIAGSRGMAGAAVMAARAAARCGAGYVACAVPEAIADIIAGAVPASTTIPLPVSNGVLDVDAALRALSSRLEKADAIVIGPGIGRQDETARFVRDVLTRWDGAAVVDADAIVALAESDLHSFPHRSKWVMTPHAGEFKRLSGAKPEGAARIEAAREFATSNDVTLLLKGVPSLVGTRDGTVLVATSGHESLATAGTGDVLSGMSGALLARGLDAPRAAAAALHIGGVAAHEFARHRAGPSMVATDLIELLPSLLFDRFSGT